MEVKILQDYLAPNGTADGVTLYKNVSTDTICYKNKRGVILPLGSSGGTVFDNVVATGTTALNTSTTLSYGVNVFTTITSTNRAAKLPAAITGQIVIVVNNTTSALTLYPSMVGGSINGVVDGVATVPPDGKPYSFYCIKNPLPGAWTWSAPATSQFDSGVISIAVSSGTGFNGNNPFITAYDNTIKTILSGFTSFNAGYNGKNKGLFLGSASSPDAIYFKPPTSWNSITKIKVYTNAAASSRVNLLANGEIDAYDISTNDVVNNGASVGGAPVFNMFLNTVIPGTAINAGQIQPYIGAPGTYWGEYTIPNPVLGTSNNSPFTSSVIGDQDFGNSIFTGSSPSQYVGQLVNNFYSCYLSFQMQPMWNANYGSNQTFEFRFIIEHT